LTGVNPRSVTAAARIGLVVAVAAISWLATTDSAVPGLEHSSDKANHAVAFLVVSLLADRSFPETRFGIAKILAVLAFGVAIEVVQYFLPYRDASFLDVVADAAGIALYAMARPLLMRIPLLRPATKGYTRPQR
jgi:VanZ family protein